MTRWQACLALVLFSTVAWGAEFKHLGVASCAASVCHGKVAPVPTKEERHVRLNEYRTWSQEDRHAQAYRTLGSAASKAIAQKLGLPNAQAAPICLDCHSDNAAARGPKFLASDGVGCEACHGGAEKWIESHAEKTATHKRNLALGMYPTESPTARARLCLNCHMGTADKFTTHAIMGAGHPRLSFEMDAFTTLQPKHFDEDKDYAERKGKIDEMNYWVTGQVEGARRFLTLLQSRRFQPGGLFPELAFYDCYGCHHSVDNLRWTSERAGPGVRPGTLRLQNYHLLMLQAATESAGATATVASLMEAGNALRRAGQTDAAAVNAAAGKLLEWLRGYEPAAQRAYSREEIVAVRKTLVRYAATDKASDYGAAEQVVLGVESLSYALGDRDQRKAAIDVLYGAVKTSAAFNPAQFAQAARGVQGQF
jgi:hypothetical protein